MKIRRRSWTIAAGVVLPAVVGLSSLIFLFAVSVWIGDHFRSRLMLIPLLGAWLTAIPVVGFVMGALSATFWRRLELTREDHCKWSNAGLWLFYIPLLFVGFWFVGFWLFLLILPAVFHINNYYFGQQWIDEGRLEEFLGRSSSTKP